MTADRKQLLIPALLAIAVASTWAAQKGNPLDGKIANGIYGNVYFGLSYPLPGDFYASQDLGTGRMGPANLLLVADRHTGTSLRERLLISADDAAGYRSWDTKQYVKKFTHATSSQPGVKLLVDDQEADFGGHHFHWSSWAQNYSGTVLYKAFLSTNVNGYFLSWTFAAASQTRLQELVETLRHISFRSR